MLMFSFGILIYFLRAELRQLPLIYLVFHKFIGALLGDIKC